MPSYLLAADLPPRIQSRLASLCYGLPQVKWLEEDNFYLHLRVLGELTPVELETIQVRLEPLFFLPFSVALEGIGHNHFKSGRGMIWAGVSESPPLQQLKKEIDGFFKGLRLPPERLPNPTVPLGYYECLNSDKLQDYLINRSLYQSDPFEITSCSLLCIKTTPKRLFYEVVDQYFASLPANGED